MRTARRTLAGPAPARVCAHRVLMRVFEQGAYADRALRAHAGGLAPRDRALAMRLAYGAVQRRGTLDHLARALAGRPLAALDPPVRASLRLGLYELLYTGGAPDRAVVSDAVGLARPSGGGGLVNAVLRRAAREARAMLDELDETTPAGAAAVHSQPGWIVQLWWEALGAHGARALMAASNEPAELALRANTLRTTARALAARLPVRTHRDAMLPEALVAEGPFAVHDTPAWAAGELVVQSRAAMLVAHALGPQAGERVLDLCAAPGGKATHLAALMHGRGEVLAVERHPGRARALERTVARLGTANVRVTLGDAAQLPAALGRGRARETRFDRVLVDPPCSGLGTLQGNPDLRWRMRPGRIAQLAAQQDAILRAAARVLRPGGLLIYSTCTISPTENERLIAAFVSSHPDFELEDLAARWPSLASARGLAATAPAGDRLEREVRERALLTLPHRDHTAGFFIAGLRRR